MAEGCKRSVGFLIGDKKVMASCSPSVSLVQKKELFDWKKDDKKKKVSEKIEK